MKVGILGIDGYLGWSLCLKLLDRGHRVVGIDNFFRRRAVEDLGSQSVIPISSMEERIEAANGEISFEEGSTLDFDFLSEFIEKHNLDVIANLAQQPSAAYSMRGVEEATFTQENNVCGGLNLLWATKNKDIPIVTIGTLGEYGCPSMNIPEGFFKVEYEGMEDILPFPKQGPSFYHVSKQQTTDNVWFACRTWVMRVTDVMQGVVYGTRTPEMEDSKLRTRFDIDECFGTAINRFVASAVSEHPITVYGTGMQKRGYIPLRDSMECLRLIIENPPNYEDSYHGHRVINQFHEYYSINELAEKVKKIGEEEFDLSVEVRNLENPRIEPEYHYYEPKHEKLQKMGYEPSTTLEEELKIMFEDLLEHKDRIVKEKIVPKIRWRE